MIGPLLITAGAIGAMFLIFSASDNAPVPQHDPDLPLQPGSTRYKLVDAIMGELRKAAAASGIPLGVLVGWIARESGGRIGEVTKLDERGLFQLMPSESKMLGVDHQRLSEDVPYSINAGLALIGHYMGDVDKLAVTPRGSSYYWRLVKLMHTMGSKAATTIVNAAKTAGVANSWDTLEKYATANDSEFLHETKHSPVKWFPLVDKVYDTGEPFGFGIDQQTTVVGAWGGTSAANYSDIVDPLDCLRRRG
jgi:hypothetical protein